MRIGIDMRLAQTARLASSVAPPLARQLVDDILARPAIPAASATAADDFAFIYDPAQAPSASPPPAISGVRWVAVPESMWAAKGTGRTTTRINGDYNALVAELRLDVLHLFGALDSGIPLPAYIVACPYVVSVETLAPRMADAIGLEWYVERLGLLMRARHVFAATERVGREIAVALGIPAQHISVAPSHTVGDCSNIYRTAAATNRPVFRIAMWSPLRPTRSGIADYVEELLPFLAQEERPHDPGAVATDETRDTCPIPTQVDIYSLDEPESDDLRDRCAVLHPSAFETIHRYQPYDALIYQIGSTPEHHLYICEQSLRYPGLLVMHDPNIHSYALARLQGGKGLQDYLSLVRDELGDETAKLAHRAWHGGTLAEEIVYKHPMDRWLLQSSRGVIYHSYFAVRDEQRRLPGVPAFYVPLYATTPIRSNEFQRQRILDRHQWPSDAVIVGTYGIVAPSKRISTLLRAFERLSALYPQVILAVVGNTANYDVLGEVRQLGLDPSRVCVTGEISMPDFLAYMQAADVGVNLRYPSLGESSAVISRMIGMGKPVITTDLPQFGELPDEFCWKVPLGDREVDVLTAYLTELVREQDLRRRMGQAASDYARESMSPQLAAEGYRQVARHVFCGAPAPHLEDTIPVQYRAR